MLAIIKRIIDSARMLEAIIGDRWFNICTREPVYFESLRGKNKDSYGYETVAYSTIRLVELKS